MKKVLQSVLTIILIGTLACQVTFSSNPSKLTKIDRIILRMPRTPRIERTFSANVEAYYHADESVLEVVCQETKETEIYILDGNSDVVSHMTDSGMCETSMLDVPDIPGTYYIVVDSSEIYAEGEFTVE